VRPLKSDVEVENFMSKLHQILIIVLFLISSASGNSSIFAGDFVEPSKKFELKGWKLQIPGPKDIFNLDNYATKYFYLNKYNEMVFWLNSAEKGATKNTKFIRSELRHLTNWSIDGHYRIRGILRVESKLYPDKVTVMKIHGFTKPGGYAPTLVRIALNDKELFAYLNRSNTPKDTMGILLEEKVDRQLFKCLIEVNKGYLTIKVNGKEKLAYDVSYWKYKSYFKAGCYPQSQNGEIKVMFKELSIWIDPDQS
jgi:hypothetical protein